MHHVPLPDAAKLIRELSDAGLSSREGCGNTVRNVTGDPWAGVAQDELFDPTPYAGAYVRYFVRHPTTQLMPRKVKTAFTATAEDRAITGIHDIAFIARERDGVRGFEMRVGGGTSIMPRVAPTLYEFVGRRRRRVPKVAEAVLRIFDRQDWLRANRARARIKVFVDKFGIDELRRQVDEELPGRLGRRARLHADRPAASTSTRRPARPRVPAAYASPNGDRTRVRALPRGQRRRPAPGGLLAPSRSTSCAATSAPSSCAALADIARDFSGGYVRTTVHQNLVLRWVRDETLYDVWQRAARARPRRARAPTQVNDVVSCPGTD